MIARLDTKLRELAGQLAFPVGAALLVLGLVRLLLSAARSCQELACDDFGRFWYATSAWLHTGRSLYAPTPASFTADGLFYSNLNLPHTHLLFVPFTALPRDVGAVAWFIAGLAAVTWTARMVAHETGWRPTAAWLIVFIWWMPTHVQVVTGQVAWVMLPLLAWSWCSARNDKWKSAGAFLGLACALKPFLLPLVAWMAWRRRLDGAAAAICAVAAAIAMGVWVFGPSSYGEWRRVATGVDWYPRSVNASLWGQFYRLFAPNTEFAHLVDLSGALAWFVGVAALAVVIICWRLCRATSNVDLQWSVVLCASLLISPLGWVYYGVWLLPGMHFRWPGRLATACWLIPTPFLFAMQPSPVATLLWGSAASWGLILTFLHLARFAVRPPANQLLEAAS